MSVNGEETSQKARHSLNHRSVTSWVLCKMLY
ncbi:hypothetical protein PSPHG_CDS_0116 [Pseudomonas phage Psxphi15]